MWLVWPVFGTNSEVTPRHDVGPGTQHERRSPVQPSPNLIITHNLSAYARGWHAVGTVVAQQSHEAVGGASDAWGENKER